MKNISYFWFRNGKSLEILEHNLFKNVSKWATFLWQTQIQTINYGLLKWYKTDKKETSYIDTWLIYTLWYEFSNDIDAQSDFGKKFVTTKYTHLDHSYLKCALG